jgi:hypothetical protein
MVSPGGGRSVTASGKAWFTYSCKALIVMARGVNKCMTALPIILNTQRYTDYLAIRRGPENAITGAGFIEALRQNASLFMEPQTRVLTKTGTETPCGGSFQPIYRNLNERWIMTNPILHIVTLPVDGVELTKEWEEMKLDDDRKFDFMYGRVYDDTADFTERYGGSASITIFFLLCFKALTWAGGRCCQGVAMNERYNWAAAGMAICSPSFMACLFDKTEGQETEDDGRIFDLAAHSNSSNHHRRAWLLRNTPHDKLAHWQGH